MSNRTVRGLTLITPADTLPLTREEVKQHLRIDHDDEDSLVDIYLAAAVAHAEDFLQRSLMPQVWEVTLDDFPPYYDPAPGLTLAEIRDLQTLELPRPPLISVDQVRYFDAAGDEIEIDAENYTVDLSRSPGFIVPVDGYDWPDTMEGANKVTIRFTAGYPDVVTDSGSSSGVISTVPAAIRAAILLICCDLYENRGNAEMPIPDAARALMSPYRVHVLA